MNKAIANILEPRKLLLDSIEFLTIEELNEIPEGFNNNIAWHLGHLIAGQQSFCYLRGRAELRVERSLQATFGSGTRPERFFGAEEIENIKSLLISTILQLEKDINNGYFVNYGAFKSRYGVAIENIHEAVRFLPHHEGLHIAMIGILKRFVLNNGKPKHE